MSDFLLTDKMKKFFEAYEAVFKPICQELDLTMPALDILVGLAHSEGNTARDISKEKCIKPTLISFHVEKLVNAGYLERTAIEGNRRSIGLVCTPKAREVIARCDRLREKMKEVLWTGISDEERKLFKDIFDRFERNAQSIIDGSTGIEG